MDKLKLLRCMFEGEDVKKYLPFVDEAMATLEERERSFLMKRYNGLNSADVRPGKARELERKIFREMKHPSRIGILKGKVTAAEWEAKMFQPTIKLLKKAEELKAVPIDNDDFVLSVRTINGMKSANIHSIGDLILKTENELLNIRHFGRKSLCEIKELLRKMGLELRDLHGRGLSPWGYYTVLGSGDGWRVKKLTVNPKGKLSLQRHNYRSEHWFIVSGKARVTVGDSDMYLSADNNPPMSISIPEGFVYRLENTGERVLEVIEFQCGAYLEEDDIERIEDEYGRA